MRHSSLNARLASAFSSVVAFADETISVHEVVPNWWGSVIGARVLLGPTAADGEDGTVIRQE
jgi:hypothetical protein